MGLLTVGGKEIVKKSTKKAANEEAANLVKGTTGKVAGSKTSAANELNLEDFTPRKTYGKFAGKYEQESGKAAREAMEGGGPLSVKSGGRLASKGEEGSNGALTRRTSLAETAAGVRGRTEKDMGMADVVEATKLSGKGAMSSGSRAGGPSSGGKAAAIAGGLAGAGGLAAIALMDRNEQKSENKASESKAAPSKASEDNKASSGDSFADKVRDMSDAKAKKTISGFEKAFAEARKSGDKTFSFGGKEFTTRLKEESVRDFNKKFESKDDFVGRMYESDKNSTRYQAGESGALAKGGFVKAKPKAMQGGVVYANCGASVKPAQKAKK